MAQLMPLPLTVSIFSKIQIGFTFLVPAHLGSPEKGAVKRGVCVCVLTNIIINVTYLIPGSYTNFRRLLCTTCDIRYYLIIHSVMKLMITG